MLDFKRELTRLLEEASAAGVNSAGPQGVDGPLGPAVAGVLAADAHLSKLLKNQAEMGYRLDELCDAAEQNAHGAQEQQRGREALVSALLAAADLIEGFYLYYREHEDAAVTPQASMMWSALQKAMAAAGLARVADERAPFDAALNTAAHAETDETLPRGWVTRCLRSGWLYNGRIIRKSSVAVNRGDRDIGDADKTGEGDSI